jgi:sulfite reductase alpha subunit-like flavoprotein
VKGNSRVGFIYFEKEKLVSTLFRSYQTFAQSTYEKLSNELNRQVILQDLNEITDPEEFLQTQVVRYFFFIIQNFLIQVKNQRTLIVFISTYEEGTPPPSAKWFLLHLQEAATDFRVSKNELEKLTYAVFGCGNSLYKENFNTVQSANFSRSLNHIYLK